MDFSKVGIGKNDLQVIKLAALYFIVAASEILFSFEDIHAAALLPAGGVGLAMMVLCGRYVWRSILVGSLLSYAFQFYLANGALSWNGAISSVLLATVVTLEVILGHKLILRFFDQNNLFKHAGKLFQFIGIASVAGLFFATAGTLVMAVTGNLQVPMLLTWLILAIAETVGILLFTPFILSWFREFRFKWSKALTLEVVAFLFVLLGLAVVSSVPYFSPVVWKSFPYLSVPFFLWLAFRFNLQISISGILLVSLLSVMFTLNGIGPFVLTSSHHSLLMLQVFIGVFSISTIVLTSTVKERQEAQRSVEQFNERLGKDCGRENERATRRDKNPENCRTEHQDHQ